MAEAPELYIEDYENYVIHARSNTNECIKKFSFLKKMFEFGDKSIKGITQITKRLFKIDCANKEFANKLVLEQPLANIDINCSVPFVNKYTSVVINDVEPQINDDDLMMVLNKVAKVHNIYRFVRTITTESGPKQIPTSTIKVSFETDYVAKYVNIMHMRLHMKAFIPTVRMCFRCCSYDHTEK